MTMLRRELGTPAGWFTALPGQEPMDGFLPRLSTVRADDPDQKAAQALVAAAAAIHHQEVATDAMVRQAGRAYLAAMALLPSDEQIRATNNARLVETAQGILRDVGPSDRELLAAMHNGLLKMARGGVARGDQWGARDFCLGRRIVATIIGVFLDMAKDRTRRAA
jgi:hypothetical protein